MISRVKYKCASGYIIISLVSLVLGQNEITNPNPGFNYTSYQESIMLCHSASKPFKARSLSDLQLIVRQAISSNFTIKPLGNRHSITDVICTDGLPISMRRINHFSYDPSTQIVTIGAGAIIKELTESLHQVGRTMLGVPTFAGATIGGILGSGIHGTGHLSEPATLAENLVSLVIVDGLGQVRNISEPESLVGFRPNFGLLGIVYEARLRTVPQFKIGIQHITLKDTILFDSSNQILTYLNNSDRFHFWWYPTLKKVILSVQTRLPTSAEGQCETHFIPEASLDQSIGVQNGLEAMADENDQLGMFVLQALGKLSLIRRVPGRTPMFTEPNSTKIACKADPPTGFFHKMVTNECEICAWDHGSDSVVDFDFSVSIPTGELLPALKTIREILADYPVDFSLNGILVRFVSKSDGLMMINGGRDSVSLEWVMASKRNRFKEPYMFMAGSQAIGQALLDKHQGKPHWAKNGLYYSSFEVIQKAYPDYIKFRRFMEEFDPNEVFMNDFGRRLKYGMNKTSLNSYVAHCALVDSCMCKKDDDCGDGSRGSLMCGELKGYKVCRERPNEYSFYRASVVRNFINKITGR